MSQAEPGIQLGSLSMVVYDLEASTRFYAEGLGFEVGSTGERGDKAAKYMEMPTCRYLVRYLRRPDLRLELVEFHTPAPLGDRQRRPNNQLGVQTISYLCPDPEATAARLVELGGTRILSDKFGNGRFDGVMMADPDGARLLLVSATVDDVDRLFAG